MWIFVYLYVRDMGKGGGEGIHDIKSMGAVIFIWDTRPVFSAVF